MMESLRKGENRKGHRKVTERSRKDQGKVLFEVCENQQSGTRIERF